MHKVPAKLVEFSGVVPRELRGAMWWPTVVVGGGRGSYEQFSTKKRRRNTGNCKKKYHSNTHFDTYFSKFNIGLKQDTNLTACSGYKLNKLAHLFLEMEISTPF